MYLVMCQILLESEISFHAIAIDTVHGQASDSLLSTVVNFDIDSWWNVHRVLNVVHVYQIMKKE